jgi:hypothetical protein
MFNLQQPDMELFKTFSDNLKKKIESSPEWQKLQTSDYDDSNVPPAKEETDDIPF